MPRKRKRSTLQRKPSLLFIESPVHVQNNVPSPVFCARDPPRANIVQVEEIHHLSWVSPQFRPGSSSVHAGRRTRRRRKSIACLRNLTKENTCDGIGDFKKQGNHKFKSLKFLGERSVNASEAEDIHITFDSATEEDTVPDGIGEIDNLSVAEARHGESRKSKRRTTQSHEGRKGSKVQDTRHATSIRTLKDISENSLENRANQYNDRLNSPESTDDDLNESSKIDFTQLRKRSVSGPPVKRLFSTQLGSARKFNNTIVTNTETQASTLASLAVVSETEPETVYETESSIDTPPRGIHVSPALVDTPPGVRRSLRIQMLKGLLQTTPAPCKPAAVLAPDTPEEEYGWSLRQRQLLKYKKH